MGKEVQVTSIEYYDDEWNSTQYFVCLNRYYIFTIGRYDPTPQWKLINSNSSYWDEIHQRIYRNFRSDKIKKEDLPAHFPSPPNTIPPEGINPPPLPSPEPIAIDKYLALSKGLLEMPEKSKMVYLVLEEDLYESRFGDGKFHYPNAIFFVESLAIHYASQKRDDMNEYHIRQGALSINKGFFECSVQGYTYDHFSDDSVFKLANKLLEEIDQDVQSALSELVVIVKGFQSEIPLQPELDNNFQEKLGFDLCQVLIGESFPPQPHSERYRSLISMAELSRIREQEGLFDSFLFVLIGCCDFETAEKAIQEYGFRNADVKVIELSELDEDRPFDDWVPEQAAAHIVEMWLRQHKGAIAHLPPEYNRTEFWWTGVEWTGENYSISNISKEFPQPFRQQARTWQSIIHQTMILREVSLIEIDELFISTMSVYEASLCEWLHGFEAASGNGYNQFEVSSMINAQGLSESWLCNELARREGISVESLCEENDVDQLGLSKIVLSRLIAEVRPQIRNALSKYFGGDAALFWALYSAIWPNYEKPMLEAMNELVMREDYDSVAKIMDAWNFVQQGWCDAAE